MPGTIGHLLILTAFVACGVSLYAFFRAARQELAERAPWLGVARTAWAVMLAGVAAASGLLVYLILTHQFQYAYVYQYSSLELPLRYVFSSFWAGQEGSFLLWVLYTGLIGVAITMIARHSGERSRRFGEVNRDFEAPVMAVVALCQLFLLSMVAGLKFGAVPIGSSPFQTLAQKFPDAPMLQVAGFVPADGNGLNDLLQNYWMMIHPPTLFVGFATMLVPFAYAVAGLWSRRYTGWVRPALPWALFANMVLILGVVLGGYWAYETLSFGGYWAWDPVENSSLVPWLVGVAAIHTMIAQKKSHTSQKAAILLSVLAYLLVVYSTFLTRSGILGDLSVHSFVDLGLNNQLLLWMLAMAGLGFGLFAHRYRELPRPRVEPRMLSREGLIFLGAMTLCAIAAVITVGTSAPIFGRLFRETPSGVPIEFYNKWSLPLAVALAFLAGLGQLFWWSKMSVEHINRAVFKPLALSFASTAAVLILTPFVRLTASPAPQAGSGPPLVEAGVLGGFGEFWAVYGNGILLLLLVFTTFFALYGNGLVLWKIGRGNVRMAGGAFAHLGLALMLFGIVTSSGFNDPISNEDGVRMQTATSSTESRSNFIIQRGQTLSVEGFRVRYDGQERTAEGHTAYKLSFTDPRGRSFEARPVVYKSKKEQWIQHPDIETYADRDVYVAVAPAAMFEDPENPAQANELQLTQGDSVVVGRNEFLIRFQRYDLDVDPGVVPDSAEIAVAAVLDVTNLATGETRTLRPVYLIMKDRTQQFIQNRVTDWKLTVTFAGMKVDDGSVRLVLEGVQVQPEDWLVVQAYSKPLISLLWVGTFMMLFGFGLALYRRIAEIRGVKRNTVPEERLVVTS